MELILVRHSITQGNREKRFIGVTDMPLAPEGEELARASAPLMPPVEGLYVSPMVRCRQTARLLWPDLEQTVVDGLRETDFGPFEGKNHAELKDDPLYQKWLAGEVAVGEPPEDCARRAVAALGWLVADAKGRGLETIGVVSHGGLLMGMMTMVGQPPRKEFYDWYPQNCSGWRAELAEAPLGLRVLAEVGRGGA